MMHLSSCLYLAPPRVETGPLSPDSGQNASSDRGLWEHIAF